MKQKEEFARKLGRLLREAREASGKTQNELSDAVGLKPPHGRTFLSRLETGRVADPRFESVMRYVQACGIKFSDFVRSLESAEPVSFEVARAQAPAPAPAVQLSLRQVRRMREKQVQRILFLVQADILHLLEARFPDSEITKSFAYKGAVNALFRLLRQAERRGDSAPWPEEIARWENDMRVVNLDMKLLDTIRSRVMAKYAELRNKDLPA